MLPVELLTQIVGYLKSSNLIHYENPQESAPALANAARVSRLFYEIAMPILWEEVQMWDPYNIRPYTLSKYSRTAKRVSPYIRTMYLHVGPENGIMDETKLDEMYQYSSECLRILIAAKHIKSLHLYIYMYNIDNHPLEVRTKLEAINGLFFHILRHVETLELDEFAWHPGSETVRCSDAVSIIERKITSTHFAHLKCEEWVNRLNNHERLRSIEVYNSRMEESSEFDRKFWTAIAHLDNCTDVKNSDVPIPFDWNVQFRNIKNLDLLLLYVGIHKWINTITAVFNWMPQLETFIISSPRGFDPRQAIEAIEISDVACKNLKAIHFGGYRPSKLLIALGNQCPNLTSCHFDLHNINDDDLYALSRCHRITEFYIGYLNPITNGLAYLTRLPQLSRLNLHYSLGRCINTQLLLDFARSCPRLDTIHVANYNGGSSDQNGPFETKDISELFAAGAELADYFEPRYRTPSAWTTEGLDKYLIRIDNLRRDRSSS